MKVQVNVKNSNKAAAASSTIEAIVLPADTALAVQERIAAATNTLCFPDQELLFNGKVIPGKMILSAAGIKDGDVLEFLFHASAQTLVKQLSELIGSKAVSPEELSLLYVYRHSIPLNDALKALGHADIKFKDFLDEQKCFCVEAGLVKVVKVEQIPPPLKAQGGHIKVRISVEVHVPGKAPECVSDEEALDSIRLDSSETVAKAKEIIAAAEQMPFPDRALQLGDEKLEDGLSLYAAGVTDGALLKMTVCATEAALSSQLEELLAGRKALSPNELSLHYCQRFGTPLCQALRTLGLHGNVRRFLEGRTRFSLSGGCVTLACDPQVICFQ